jgi:ABC-2 type transport system ATP-binding protein
MKTVPTLPRAGSVTPGPGTAVISVTGLRKRYGNVEAVRGIDLAVQHGEVFAFLGPNGAGKPVTEL